MKPLQLSFLASSASLVLAGDSCEKLRICLLAINKNVEICEMHTNAYMSAHLVTVKSMT
jgi:hypothetical protein